MQRANDWRRSLFDFYGLLWLLFLIAATLAISTISPALIRLQGE
jgi:hypothetical protein